MKLHEIQKLLNAVKEAEMSEFTLETGDVRLHMKRGGDPVEVPASAPAPAAAAPAAAAPVAASSSEPAPVAPVAATPEVAEPAPAADARFVDVTAPIVGTFYASPSPDAEPYVQVGDHVEAGTVLCIIEAMKLMNEIEAETSGTIKEVRVRNEDPVEYGQVLFRIDPD